MSDSLTREFYPWVDESHTKAWIEELVKQKRLIGITLRPYKGKIAKYHGKDIKVVHYKE